MEGFFKKDKMRMLIWNIFVLILGLLLCFLRGSALGVLERIISISLIIYAIVCIVYYCISPLIVRDNSLFLQAIFILIVGVLLNIFPAIFIIGIGILIALEGLQGLTNSINLKNSNVKNWWIDFICGFITFCLGLVVVILFNTSTASSIVSILLGVTLLVYSIENLVLILVLHREIKKIKKSESDTTNSDDDFTDYTIK